MQIFVIMFLDLQIAFVSSLIDNEATVNELLHNKKKMRNGGGT